MTAKLPDGEAGTGVTNDKWSLPLLRELGFGLLPTTTSPEAGGRTYAISRFFGPVPVHLVGCGLSLDRRAAGQRGAASVNPHGLVQEFLNRSPDHLWALLGNGLRLRVLRDNHALSRQSFLEFDLQAIFEGELYSEFVLFWLVTHATRFAPREGDRPDSCWIEQWTAEAAKQGTRALEGLRDGVEQALQVLGEGFTSHPKNIVLRDLLRSGQLPLPDFHGQLLRVVYRLIFLFVSEERKLDGQSLLHPRDDSITARTSRERFALYYGSARLRELAGKIRGSRHSDLWRQFQLVAGALSGASSFAAVRRDLALPALGSFLWSGDSTAAVNNAELTNHDFLEALRHLCFTRQGKILRPVDYRNLGAEELGGVYESLLALTPQVSADGARFSFAEFAGSERKTSGSYYTPDSLVQCLLDAALDPVVEEAIKGKSGAEAEQAILGLKVCDPAVGSGHFLVGAAHRMARHLARVRALAQGESEPSPTLYQHALRDVIGHCLYGVDVNAMAAELCRVSLWLEALEPGKPLSFLDHHIRVGNSLLGATPELIAGGLPDAVFTAIEGDDKTFCSALRQRNKQERSGQTDMLHLMVAEPTSEYDSIVARTRDIDEAPDDTIEAIRRKEEQFGRLVVSPKYRHAQLVADAWCAAVVWRKQRDAAADPLTTETLRRVEADSGALTKAQRAEVERLAEYYQFFHWHLAFPEVFASGGFDCVLGNPPWDTLSPDQREFFGKWVSGIRSMAPEQQQAAVARLLEDPEIASRWLSHCRDLFAFVHFLKNSGAFTLYAAGNLGKGDFNVYRMFVELAIRKTRLGGFVSQVVPAGFYGGANASAIRKHALDDNRLCFLAGCENKGGDFFPGVHSQTWFAVYALQRGGRTVRFRVTFGVDSIAKALRARTDSMELEADVTRQHAPDTYAISDLRNVAELTTSRKMYSACPALGDRVAGPPFRHYMREVDMGNDRGLFTEDPAGLPVYEGRMIDHFDHRAKAYESGHGNSSVWIEREFGDPAKAIVPQWRVLRENIPGKLGDRCDQFRIGFCDVANPRNERSLTAALIPPGVVCGDKVPTLDFGLSDEWFILPWLAVANTLAVDWMARCRLTAPKMAFSLLDSLPFPRPGLPDALVQTVAPVVLQLVCTAPEMTPFWNRMAKLGFVEPVAEGTVPPAAFIEPTARAIARAKLDALVAFRVFGLNAQELADLIDTFGVLQRREQREHKEFRTKRLVLEAFATLA
ncbi:MAG TPA: N-6 DNA methylase [Gemmatimonadaceae bacterium]